MTFMRRAHLCAVGAMPNYIALLTNSMLSVAGQLLIRRYQEPLNDYLTQTDTELKLSALTAGAIWVRPS